MNSSIEAISGLIVALATLAGAWLAWRTRGAKRSALEKLVAEAVEKSEQNHKAELDRLQQQCKDEIARNEKQNQETVTWLQGQIKYYQEMSAPRAAQRPNHPPQ